jgi:hypothetical protein
VYEYPVGATYFLVHATYTSAATASVRKFGLFADASGGPPLIEFLDGSSHDFSRGVQATFTLKVDI